MVQQTVQTEKTARSQAIKQASTGSVKAVENPAARKYIVGGHY